MMEPIHKLKRWLFGEKTDAQGKVRRSLDPVSAVAPVTRQGNTTGNATGVPAGGVMWRVLPDTHDGASFIAADVFLAEYVAQEQKAYCLDDINTRHVGAEPLVLGRDLFLLRPLLSNAKGIVVRSAEYGTDGISKNIFIPSDDPKLVAHHVGPDPNRQSTFVFDADGRKAPLDDQFRVRMFGNGRSTSGGNPFAIHLNFGTSGVGENRGHGLAHFNDAEARLGMGMDGPLRAASAKHDHEWTGESFSRAGAINTNAFFTNGAPAFDAPLDFEFVEEPDVKESQGIPSRVHLQMDTDKTHGSIKGDKPGCWRWHIRLPVVETPPCKDSRNYQSITVAAQEGTLGPAVYMTGPLWNHGFDCAAVDGWWR